MHTYKQRKRENERERETETETDRESGRHTEEGGIDNKKEESDEAK